jgi:hypothetical protein
MPISDQVLMIDAKGAPKRRLLVPRPRKKYRLGAAMSYTGFSVVFSTNSLGSRQDEDVYCFTLDHGCFAFFSLIELPLESNLKVKGISLCHR